MASHCSLRDNKSFKSPGLFSVFWPISIMHWMVSSCPNISNFFSLCTNPFMTVPRAPITSGIIVTFIIQGFFRFPSKVEVIIPLFPFFWFHSVVHRDSKIHNFARSLFFFCWSLKDLVVWPRFGDPFVSWNLTFLSMSSLAYFQSL